jgi:hypothetical protein
MKIFLLTILLLLQSLIVLAQKFEFTDNCKKAYNEIISLEFSNGKKILNLEKKTNPDNLLPILYDSYIDFLEAILGEEKSKLELFKDQKRKRIRAIKSGDRKSPYYRYTLANLYLHHAFARLKFKEYFKALFEIKKAFNLLEKNVEEFPEFTPNLIGMGLLHSIIGSIPDNYKWVSWLASMDGTIEQGKSELYQVLEEAERGGKYSCFLTEAAFYLTFIEVNLNVNNKNTDRLLYVLDSKAENTPLIVYAKLSILMRTAKNDIAIELLNGFKQSPTAFQFHYLSYLNGMALLNQLNPAANKYFKIYLDKFKGYSYVKSAYQKIAWLKLIKNDTQAYKEKILLCKEFGNKNLDGDKQAEKEVDSEAVPNIPLLKARLLFDGGYYDESLKILNDGQNQITDFNLAEETEYYYRLARNYQEKEDHALAISFFKKTIKKGNDLLDYFAGNSCLQLGTIYEMDHKIDSARYYYKMCLDMDFKTYKTSLDFKAKAKLKKLE